MTTCVNPTITNPNTFPYGGYGAFPGAYPTSTGGAIPQSQPFGSFTPNAPTSFFNPQWPSTQWPVNTAPFFGQPVTPGSTNSNPWNTGFNPNWNAPANFINNPWSGTFGFNPVWNTGNTWNSAPYGTIPQTNGYGSTTPFNGWNTPGTPWQTPWTTNFNTTPFNGWNTPGTPWQTPWTPNFNTTPFNGWNTPGTPWQTPWTPNFNITPFANSATPFIGNYTPSAPVPNFASPITSGWNNVAAAINTLSQPGNWSPFTGTPIFNSTPWTSGYPAFGNTIPGSGFSPFNYGFPFPGFPMGFANTPWVNGIPVFGPTNAVPFTPTIPGQCVTPNTPGMTGYAPTPGTGIPTTRTNIQNGDGSYRNAA